MSSRSSHRGSWHTSMMRWPELDLTLPLSIFRWPVFGFSGWNPLENLLCLSLSLLDDVLWAIVSVLESVALLAMFCYFFLFCGGTL